MKTSKKDSNLYNMDITKYFDSVKKLSEIHNNHLIIEGSWDDEYPEQLMIMMFLNPNAKVLEIGSNIGRSTVVIASILSNSENLVTLESDPKSFEILNKNLAKFNVHTENAALSKRDLYQKEWITYIQEIEGSFKVNTITFDDIQKKYNIIFDTIVADCEGALYYILMDDPDILNNINMIIMENDYYNIHEKLIVNKIIIDKGFRCHYRQEGGWGCCYCCFYETWIRAS